MKLGISYDYFWKHAVYLSGEQTIRFLMSLLKKAKRIVLSDFRNRGNSMGQRDEEQSQISTVRERRERKRAEQVVSLGKIREFTRT